MAKKKEEILQTAASQIDFSPQTPEREILCLWMFKNKQSQGHKPWQHKPQDAVLPWTTWAAGPTNMNKIEVTYHKHLKWNNIPRETLVKCELWVLSFPVSYLWHCSALPVFPEAAWKTGLEVISPPLHQTTCTTNLWAPLRTMMAAISRYESGASCGLALTLTKPGNNQGAETTWWKSYNQ